MVIVKPHKNQSHANPRANPVTNFSKDHQSNHYVVALHPACARCAPVIYRVNIVWWRCRLTLTRARSPLDKGHYVPYSRRGFAVVVSSLLLLCRVVSVSLYSRARICLPRDHRLAGESRLLSRLLFFPLLSFYLQLAGSQVVTL